MEGKKFLSEKILWRGFNIKTGNVKRIIRVVSHNPDWKEKYRKEAEKIKNIFSNIIDIYHIGSTAIKRIKAKPVIDILVEIEDINEVDKHNEEMREMGYRVKGENGIPGRRYFEKGEPQHTHHVHVFETGNNEIKRHIKFRDYLNSHPAEAENYSLLKEKLAEEYKYDAAGYTEAKGKYIKQIERKAENDQGNFEDN